MSRGLSKIQRAIMRQLEGPGRGHFYRCGSLGTRELVEELKESGILREDMPSKFSNFTVRRACFSLVRRGLVEGRREMDLDHPEALTIIWWAVSNPPPPDPEWMPPVARAADGATP